jgi:hypothetical protein
VGALGGESALIRRRWMQPTRRQGRGYARALERVHALYKRHFGAWLVAWLMLFAPEARAEAPGGEEFSERRCVVCCRVPAPA